MKRKTAAQKLMDAVAPAVDRAMRVKKARAINWKVSKEDWQIIHKITARAFSIWKLDRVTLEMDLIATHLNGTPLRLKEFLEADNFNFGHDVFGIQEHIDRNTGKLTRCFLPRFYDHQAAKAVRV